MTTDITAQQNVPKLFKNLLENEANFVRLRVRCVTVPLLFRLQSL
jgi:hypothetical protein